jgi:hypothetical protein
MKNFATRFSGCSYVTRMPKVSTLNSAYRVAETVRGYNYTLNKSVEVDDPVSL